MDSVLFNKLMKRKKLVLYIDFYPNKRDWNPVRKRQFSKAKQELLKLYNRKITINPEYD